MVMKSSWLHPKCFAHQVALATAAALLAHSTARADLIELVNGDQYNGAVVGMSATQLEFKSDIQGVVKIPREKVARITFREIALKPGAPAAARGTNAASFSPAFKSAAAASNKAGILNQPNTQAKAGDDADADLIAQIQEQIIGKNNPEASGKFNQMMAGFMTGSLSVEDIRNQARSAVKDIEAAKKDLGPDAGMMLDGYLKILQDFLADGSTTISPAKTSGAKQ